MDFPKNTAEISAMVKARQKPVDNSVSLEAYFTTADHVGLQVLGLLRTLALCVVLLPTFRVGGSGGGCRR